MIQYRLIKVYPGSPKFGAIAEDVFLSTTTQMSWFPEFWQKVEEVDYEILSYSGTRSNTVIKKSHPNFKLMKEDFLYNIDPTVFIHSIKRLSDGEVFTIGDKCKYIDVIATFRLKEDKIIVVGEKATDFLNHIRRYKTPLFTTEDGVAIFEGDLYYLVSKDFCIGFCSFYSKSDLTYKLFSTKEKAEEYILLNKPLLSLNDLLSTWGNAEYPKHTPLFRRFESIAKSKL